MVEARWKELGLAELASRPAELVVNARESPSLLATILLAMIVVVVRPERRRTPAAVEGTAIDPPHSMMWGRASAHLGHEENTFK